MKDYYDILEITNKRCSIEEIKKNYRKLSLKYHPDKNNGDKEYEEIFKSINEAYDILSNEESRKIYDIQYFFKGIDITEEDYNLLLIYYNKIINSNEYKLFKLLYNSIPPLVKEDIWNKFKSKNKNNIIVKAQKSIDITKLFDDITINLVITKHDYENDILKVVYIFSNSGNYYLYLRKPPKILIFDNANSLFIINFYIVN